MLLVGMLDSPYVRRSAIAATLLGVTFEHQSVSVFRHMDRFRAINPLIKAPSLVTDDGTVLMESQLIIQHLEDVSGKSLRPVVPTARIADLRATGLAIVTCEKAIGIEYERKRPEAVRYQPWLDRVRDQLQEALAALDMIACDQWKTGPGPWSPGAIGAAVAWGFIRFTIPDVVPADAFPALAAHAARCEATEVFKHWPIDRETP
ncbi:glutathione S-transferase family protein [Phreatobacter stygius]|uniref:Glutathione S-transferase n=1 Tax=Phreatobacter stygius TaxID=1940610 RepID=A0A4D7AYX3_9HYPH|nr:glutathione S-transferase [Phreatobacter stygius]QCI62880.1 glutathione S-transferase [Phreatobacter stygius]